jgi:lipopolysaccharide/colanic/teichoic acid biosynthesis glycosyltransferase
LRALGDVSGTDPGGAFAEQVLLAGAARTPHGTSRWPFASEQQAVSLLPSALETADEQEIFEYLQSSAAEPARLPWLLKRVVDLWLSATALVVFSPVMALSALAIKIESPGGPVIFAHERVGLHGRRFRLYKLRTMVPDAEARVAELQTASAHPAWLLLDRDPRITRVGRLLRRTSADELPQLLNVLRGEMSLVGPRPLPPYEDAHVPSWGRRRLDVPPGITGLWQVLGRVAIPFEEMIKLDYLYVANWTLRDDLAILLRTVGVVLSQRGAN